MTQAVRILGIAGSLRRESYNRAALRAAMQLVPDGATLQAFELDGIPGFNQDEERNPPARVTELKQRLREADAVLIVTPEYNYSVPGCVEERDRRASRPYGDNACRESRRRSWVHHRDNRYGARAVPPAADLRLSNMSRSSA